MPPTCSRASPNRSMNLPISSPRSATIPANHTVSTASTGRPSAVPLYSTNKAPRHLSGAEHRGKKVPEGENRRETHRASRRSSCHSWKMVMPPCLFLSNALRRAENDLARSRRTKHVLTYIGRFSRYTGNESARDEFEID
jgi:hypothetical protein